MLESIDRTSIFQINQLNLKIGDLFLMADFNLNLESNKRLGITGPSGCGKTTLLRSIISGYPPQKSNYNKFKFTNNKGVKPKIGYMPQIGGLLPWFTLRRNIDIYNNDSSILFNSLSDNLELNNILDSYPDQLSGGEIQRGILACAILSKPQIFLADEPLSEVDLGIKWKSLFFWSSEIEKLKASLILVSHDIEILLYLCDEIIILDDRPAQISKKLVINAPHPRRKQDIISGSPEKARIELINLLDKFVTF